MLASTSDRTRLHKIYSANLIILQRFKLTQYIPLPVYTRNTAMLASPRLGRYGVATMLKEAAEWLEFTLLRHNDILAGVQLLVSPEIHRLLQQRDDIRIKRLPVGIIKMVFLALRASLSNCLLKGLPKATPKIF